MNLDSEFTWIKARQTIDDLIVQQTGKHLSDLEILILEGAWEDKTYEEIAEDEGYSSSYLSKDIGSKFWHNLSLALSEKVSKKNFKAAIEREWHKQIQINLVGYQSAITNSLVTEKLTFPEGSVALSSPLYIERAHCESLAYETVSKPGALIRIKGAKWMGKTSLVHRILEQGHIQEQRTVYLDFGSVERSIVRDLDKLLRWLCVMVSRQLQLENQVNDYWDTDILGSNDNCTVYFEEYILANITSAIAIAFDNVDRLFAYETVIEDFFGMLRSWHEKGKIHHCWAQLKLILAHSTEVYIPLDINQSPFNAGVPILLEEFTISQIEKLAYLYQLEWEQSQITKLSGLVGGHPYLLRLAMYRIKSENLSLDRFLQEATSETGIYSNPLRRLLNILKQADELSSAYAKVVQSDKAIALDSLQIYQLHSLGLVRHQQNLVAPSCKLYRDYFKRVLVTD